MIDNDHEILHQMHTVWRRKPVLQRLYADQFYSRLLANRASGSRNLEIGSGFGFMNEIDPAVWRTDVLFSANIHCVSDAQRLPVQTASLDNIIGLDVLHHVNLPLQALREVARVLRPGGRFVLVEPWITPLSRFIYNYLHHEQYDLGVRPWEEQNSQFGEGKMAFDGNAAVPYLLVQCDGGETTRAVPALRLIKLETFSSLTYLLSMGYRPINFLPSFAYQPLYWLERATYPLWRSLAAMRALIVWEKTGTMEDDVPDMLQMQIEQA